METRVVLPASSAVSPAKRRKAAQGLAIDLEQLEADPQAAALSVLCLLDGWQEAKPDDVEVLQLSGAMTNLVFRVAYQQQVVLLRVHASKSDLFERSEEIATFQAVAHSGIGPQLLLLFANGRVEEFLGEHVTLGAGDLRDPEVSAAIATATAEFHFVLTEQLASSPLHNGPMIVWTRLWHWLTLCERLWGLGSTANAMDGSSNAGGVEASSTANGLAGSSTAKTAAVDGQGSSSSPGSTAAGALDGSHTGAPAADGLGPSSNSISAPTGALAYRAHGDGGNGVAEPAVATAVTTEAAAAAGAIDTAEATEVTEAAGTAGATDTAEAVEVAAALVQLRRQLPVLQALLMAKYPCWVAMCHNDLQYGNIMVKAPPAHLANGATASSTSAANIQDLRAALQSGQSDSDLATVMQTQQLQQPVQQPQKQPQPQTPSSDHQTLTHNDVDIALRVHSTRSDTSRSGGSRRLPDGSFVLPGVESRPRGQSPVRNPYERALGAGSFGSSIGNSFSSSVGIGVGSSIGIDASSSFGDEDDRRGRQQQRQRRVEASADAAIAAVGAASFGDARGGDYDSSSSGCSSSSDDDDVGAAAAGTPRHGSHSKQQVASSRLSRASATTAPADGADDGHPAAGAGCATEGADLEGITGHRAASHGSESMRLIDYEYSGFNPIAFDVANHWCEWAADYHGPEPATMDYGRMPNKAQQRIFIAEYLAALLRCAGVQCVDAHTQAGSSEDCEAADGCVGLTSSSSSSPTSSSAAPGSRAVAADTPAVPAAVKCASGSNSASPELRDLWQWLELYEPGVSTAKQLSSSAKQQLAADLHEASLRMVCLSAAQWALWGWAQLRSSDVDYDFAEYARQRWGQYLSTRPPELQRVPSAV